MASISSTPRGGTQRPKRSNMSLSDLRVAPLSAKFAEPPREYEPSKGLVESASDLQFSKQHSSYLQGRSAPSTPGILSRTSSRKHLGGGLSRRGSLYDEASGNGPYEYEYAAVSRDILGNTRVDVGSGQIPKAKSDAAMYQQRLKGKGVSLKKRVLIRPTSGTVTPRPKHQGNPAEEDWLTRTGAATSALLQESKGQSWLASSQSTTSIDNLSADEDDDDQYEEMAALSASTAKLQYASGPGSPVQFRSGMLSPVQQRRSTWGSRYGSRSASRRASRRSSFNGSRTPLASSHNADVIAGYFDEEPLAFPDGPDFVDTDEGNSEQDEAEVKRLTKDRSFGLGSLVDRLMGLDLFNVDESEEASDQESRSSASKAEARDEAKTAQQQQQQQRLRPNLAAIERTDGKEGVAEGEQPAAWSDAAWLMSVASKAMFQ
ncbi:hypothetical protein K431DRAFT_44590 [Polychaeton citri CBS 116435]|uniref:DUF3984 domain-containing protein n=1 Tax=Polychaeton citri CBS 116435 TaxID=1314669 RepID=A0A9P4URD6_9PEZI|nr:hypothetical protein K431DRAFT_44590 [Polychaeton citri CBS 116435]